MERDKAADQDRATHDHGGRSEQDARIAGEHGWGYGGRPPETEAPETTAANTARDGAGQDHDERGDHATRPDAIDSVASSSSTRSSAAGTGSEDTAQLAPGDLDGHDPDWRR